MLNIIIFRRISVSKTDLELPVLEQSFLLARASADNFLARHSRLTETLHNPKMKIKDLLDEWHQSPMQQLTARKYTARLPVWDAARIAALAELFPARTKTQIITDLLHAALDDLESKIPYQAGDKIVSEDDHGDPIYEDTGLTPRYKELARQYAETLKQEAEGTKQAKRGS